VSGSDKKPILDATAVLAIIQEEAGAERLLPLCREAAVSAVNIAEVLAKLISKGVPRAEAQAAVDALHVEALPFEPAAASLSAFYTRKGVSWATAVFWPPLICMGPAGQRTGRWHRSIASGSPSWRYFADSGWRPVREIQKRTQFVAQVIDPARVPLRPGGTRRGAMGERTGRRAGVGA